jgi:hypothetical protein
MNRLPEPDQMLLESQRPLLAVLDTTLVLVVRSMRAEHPELEDDAYRGLGAEPPPTQRALAASIVLLANSLRALLDGYGELLEHIHGDRNAALDDDSSF